MSRTEPELRAQLATASRMPEGDAKIALLEELMRHADASGSTRLAFDIRMALTNAYQHGGETGKAFVTFSWCLAAYDRNPSEYTANDDGLLRWHYKWTVAALKRFPEVPLDRSYRALDDMEARYLAGGHSLHAVYTLRCEVANHIGDLAAADKWYDEWCAAPRDENSDCVACDPTSKVWHLAARGRDEEAVAVADPVLTGRITCQVQPQSIQAALLLPYLRTGRLDEAREAHRRGYRAIRGNRDYLDQLATHLEFCALTGNEAHGLELLERHLGWLDRPADPMALMEGAGAAALLLRRVRERGHGGQRLRRRGFGDRPDTEPEVAELEAELRRTAVELAERFDARNGTDHQSRLLTEKLEAEPLVELSLSRPWQRRTRSTVVVDKTVDTAVDSVDTERATPDISGLDPKALLDLADREYLKGRSDAVRAALRQYDKVVADTEVDPIVAARRYEAIGLEQILDRDREAAITTWRAAADRYAELGDQVLQQHVLGRVGAALVQLGRDDEGTSLIEASAEYLRVHGTAEQQARALLRLEAIDPPPDGRGFDFLEEAEAAVERMPESDEKTLLGADVKRRRATLLGRNVESLPRAAEEVAQAREAMLRVGSGDYYAGASILHGQILVALADHGPDAETDPAKSEALLDEAAECFAEAARHAGGAPELRAIALELRGGLLARTRRADEAVNDLVEVVAIHAEEGVAVPAHVRFDLAVALVNAQRPLDAAECAEEGLDEAERTGDETAVYNFRHLLTRLYTDLGEKTDALRQWDALADHHMLQASLVSSTAAASPAPADATTAETAPGGAAPDDTTTSETIASDAAPLSAGEAGIGAVEASVDEEADAERVAHLYRAAQAHEAAADLLDDLGRDAEAAQRFTQAVAAYQQAGDPFGTVRGIRRRVLSLHWSGDTDGALELAESLSEQIDQLPDTSPEAVVWERAALDFNVARVLATSGRLDEALPRARAAERGFQEASAADDATYARQLADDIANHMEAG